MIGQIGAAAAGDKGADPEISVLIVSWRTREHVVECVRATLDAVSARQAEIIVIDNDSCDGTVELLHEEYDAVANVVIVPNASNRGFAAGNNQAYAMSSGSLVAIVNPDARPTSAALDRLIELLRSDPSIGMASCCLVGTDGSVQTLHRRLPTLWIIFGVFTTVGAWIDHRVLGCRTRDSYKLLDGPRVGVVDVGQVAGAFMLIRRSIVEEQLGGVLFDERLPILMNDVDLSRRIADAGLRRVVDWDVAIQHAGAASLRQIDRSALRAILWDGLQKYYATHESWISRVGLAVARRLTPRRGQEDLDERDPYPVDENSAFDLTQKPLVTVVIPCYNYGHFVEEAIESALAQTYESVEIIIINDGSTDDSASVVDSYADRAHIVHQSNRGLSAVRNHGAKLAKGRFVVYLDADDTLEPVFIEHCVDALLRHPAAGFAYTQVDLVDEFDRSEPTMLGPYSLERLLQGNEIAACALIRTELVRRFPYDEGNLIGWEDWDFWLLLAEHGWGGILVDEVLVTYRRHGANMTARIRGVDKRRLRYVILRRHARLVGIGHLVRLRHSIVRMQVSTACRRTWERLPLRHRQSRRTSATDSTTRDTG